MVGRKRARVYLSLCLCALGVSVGCKVVVPPAAGEPIAIGQPAEAINGTRYLEYRIGVDIKASPDAVWGILTDASAFPTWNSTVVSLEGPIALGNEIKLVSIDAPDRTFKLTVSTFEPGKKLVWEDGGKAFKGVRTFTLTEQADGSTRLTMSEVLTGAFLEGIEKKLPDFRPSFDVFAADLVAHAEKA